MYVYSDSDWFAIDKNLHCLIGLLPESSGLFAFSIINSWSCFCFCGRYLICDAQQIKLNRCVLDRVLIFNLETTMWPPRRYSKCKTFLFLSHAFLYFTNPFVNCCLFNHRLAIWIWRSSRLYWETVQRSTSLILCPMIGPLMLLSNRCLMSSPGRSMKEGNLIFRLVIEVNLDHLGMTTNGIQWHCVL